MTMVEDTHPSYDLFQMFLSTSDSGHAGAKRDRTYVICSHQEHTSCTYDPEWMLSLISRRMKSKVQTVPSDYFLATIFEVQQEAQQLAIRRKIPFQPCCNNMEYLLTQREENALRSYEKAYFDEYRRSAKSDPDLIFFLGDNGSTWRTWSAKSGAIPTFRRNCKSGLFWIPSLGRFLTSQEKLAALSWPVDHHISQAMNCQPVGSQDILRAADIAGNAMHFASVGLAQLLALSCFRPMT